MTTLSIHRDNSDAERTLGELFVDGRFAGYTVERPWLDNKNNISCVPDGVYDVVFHDSQKHGKTVALVNPDLNVYYLKTDRPMGKGRFLCLLAHVGNKAHDVEGCVALGQFREPEGVVNSTKAINAFRHKVDLTKVDRVIITSRSGMHL